MGTSATSGTSPMLSHVKANFTCPAGGASEIKITANGKDKDTCFKYEPPNMVKGVDMTLSGNAGGSLTLETNYSPLDNVGTKLEFCTDLGDKKDLLASVNASSNGIKATVDTNFCLTGGAMKDFNFKLDYKSGKNLGVVKTSNQRTAITASFAQQCCKTTYWGAQVDYNTKDSSTNAQFGCKQEVGTFTNGFLKINSSGVLCLSVEHKLSNPNLKVNAASQFDLLGSNPLGAKAFGIGLTFGDF